jgi:hypothetical protein
MNDLNPSLLHESTNEKDTNSPSEEEFISKPQDDSIMSEFEAADSSGKFSNKTCWQKFEDYVWYDAHKHFEELAYNGGVL